MDWIKFWVINKKYIDFIVFCYIVFLKKDIVKVFVIGVEVFVQFFQEDRFKYFKNKDIGIKKVVFGFEILFD